MFKDCLLEYNTDVAFEKLFHACVIAWSFT